ncbi:MAG: RNA pseudouridine synthase [Geminicoccaceae bacterium]|nr:RNA pseudouridine synthase [Geminicoccaceae bacterium]
MEVDLAARLLYRDGLVLVIDKPAGLPVHAGPKGGPNLEHFLDALRFGYPRRPALAHRLDRDTSGCLVLGRHPAALRRLGRLFATGAVAKTYWAVVIGGPEEEEGRIELPLSKRSALRGWWMKVDPAGQPAITSWRVLGRADGLAWLELRPLTGRTHQLRVHAEASGWPVLGDPIYGRDRQPTPLPPLHLHARAIVLPLRENKPPIRVEAPPPPHMREALARCGFRPPSPEDGPEGRERAPA